MANEEKILEQLIPTWQTLTAIAYRANVTTAEALDILLKMTDKGIVKKNRVRLDGHNKVHFFRKV